MCVCVCACVCVFLFKTIIAVVVIFVFYVAWEFLFSLGIFYSNVLGFVETESGALVLAVCVCVCVVWCRGASHSAVADMQCITQEAPSNVAARHNIDRYMARGSRDRDNVVDSSDDFELIRSGPPRYTSCQLDRSGLPRYTS